MELGIERDLSLKGAKNLTLKVKNTSFDCKFDKDVYFHRPGIYRIDFQGVLETPVEDKVMIWFKSRITGLCTRVCALSGEYLFGSVYKQINAFDSIKFKISSVSSAVLLKKTARITITRIDF